MLQIDLLIARIPQELGNLERTRHCSY